jgi:hypothetical protein
MHNVITIIQAVVRGMQLRTWFRETLSTVAARFPNRDYFRRLASIGAGHRSLSASASPGVDMLAAQVRGLPRWRLDAEATC